MPATAFLRAAARVVESDGDEGEGLDDHVWADLWARLEALPDPRSPQGRIYSLASLVAVALCGLTAAGHDRLTGIGQWAKRADPAERARLGLPWDPLAGEYRVPDEKTVRTVLDRLGPRSLSRALLRALRNVHSPVVLSRTQRSLYIAGSRRTMCLRSAISGLFAACRDWSVRSVRCRQWPEPLRNSQRYSSF